MTRDEFEKIITAGSPFTIFMADGRQYDVPHRDYIWLPPAKMFVVVSDDSGYITMLPLRTVTGVKAKAPSDSGV
jgi:hypothetical protein